MDTVAEIPRIQSQVNPRSPEFKVLVSGLPRLQRQEKYEGMHRLVGELQEKLGQCLDQVL
jgi:hypothetical protein